MKRIITAAAIVIAACLAGCNENQMLEYENSPAIYFSGTSTLRSFFLLPSDVTHDTVWVEVLTMGLTADSDRPVSVVQANAGKPYAAVAGTHYVPFDNPDIAKKMVVPAGAVKMRIPVVAIKDASLELKKVELELAVAQNDHFRPGIDKQRNYLVTITSMVEKPDRWDNFWRHFFGPTWGPRKFRFIIDATGYYDWDILPDDSAFLEDMRSVTIQKFLEYEQAHPGEPMVEANGDLVVFN